MCAVEVEDQYWSSVCDVLGEDDMPVGIPFPTFSLEFCVCGFLTFLTVLIVNCRVGGRSLGPN